MSIITDIRCALTRKALMLFVLSITYQRRLPLSSFLVDILRHFRINISQLSMIGAANVSHFEILYGVHEIVPTVKYLFTFIHAHDPKVKIVKREQVGDEPLLLQTIVGRTVPLLSVAPDHADSELETSIDKLFDEGIMVVKRFKEVPRVLENGPTSNPLLRTPSGPSIAGTYRSAVQRLLARVVLNAEARGDPIPTLPFVTSFVSATPEREGKDHTDSMTGLYLRTISASQRSSVPVMTVVTTTTPTADLVVVVKEKTAVPSMFVADSSFADGADPNAGSVTNGSRLDDGRVCREMVDEFDPLKFFASVRGMEHDQLFTEFNVGATRQMSLSAKVRMRAEYNIREKRRLKSAVDERGELLKSKDKEIENLKAHMVLKEAEATKAIRLRAEASIFERNALDLKVTDLEASAIRKECKLTDLHAQLTSVKSRNDSLADQVHELEVTSSALQERLSSYENLTEQLKEFQDSQLKLFTHGMELAISKCLNCSEYLSALGVAIGKAIEKGMQDGLSAEITHGMEGRALTDVAAYNPFTEADYISALQRLQSVNFSLLAKLRSNKDASTDTVMNILRLEETLAERLGLTELQPHVDQLMVPIHHSPDKTVVGATSLSFALDVSNVRVLTGVGGTSDTVSATAVATTTLSTTLASASTAASISVDDYVVADRNDQAGADGNADPFPNVDDAELNIL
uniref:Transposase (Putative), gypsy type n=1 Tax=Tanacetum cinerariifolium TaxID=118510 RepID=A0A699HSQ0_TANCI|nr:transposase (putative), gypsy type [Tanacetum cinerariifolium]